jgi:hypothetical protein
VQAERRTARGRERRRARAQEAQAERRARGLVAQGTRKEPAKFAGKSAEVPEFLFDCGFICGLL